MSRHWLATIAASDAGSSQSALRAIAVSIRSPHRHVSPFPRHRPANPARPDLAGTLTDFVPVSQAECHGLADSLHPRRSGADPGQADARPADRGREGHGPATVPADPQGPAPPMGRPGEGPDHAADGGADGPATALLPGRGPAHTDRRGAYARGRYPGADDRA